MTVTSFIAGLLMLAGLSDHSQTSISQNEYNIFDSIPFEKKFSSFHGYQCADFVFNGRKCKVVKPNKPASHRNWIWRARFWGHEPQTDLALLEKGFHVVYCDVVELFGNTEAIRLWNEYYALLTKAGLATKAVLEGMSRGGVYIYNWAAANPTKVACIYADNPVLDLTSWPGIQYKSNNERKKEWETFKQAYRLGSDEEALQFKGSPIYKVKEIVAGGYPMLHVCGDADEVVLMSENTLPFADKVKALGGRITIIHKPGFKHHPHSLPDPKPIVDFILSAVDY